MKTEIVNIPNRGICILISDINPKDLMLSGALPTIDMPFTDVHEIAKHIRLGHKIAAIKEVRSQTGWGLKDSKDYLDKYYPSRDYNGLYNEPDFVEISDKFVLDHSPAVDFIGQGEMEI